MLATVVCFSTVLLVKPYVDGPSWLNSNVVKSISGAQGEPHVDHGSDVGNMDLSTHARTRWSTKVLIAIYF